MFEVDKHHIIITFLELRIMVYCVIKEFLIIGG